MFYDCATERKTMLDIQKNVKEIGGTMTTIFEIEEELSNQIINELLWNNNYKCTIKTT